jgi:hypothetical protein
MFTVSYQDGRCTAGQKNQPDHMCSVYVYINVYVDNEKLYLNRTEQEHVQGYVHGGEFQKPPQC